jgi:hypothetical protein
MGSTLVAVCGNDAGEQTHSGQQDLNSSKGDGIGGLYAVDEIG